MSFARKLYHPLHHIWIRAKEPLAKKTNYNNALQHPHKLLEIGLTERGLEDIGDITFVKPSAAMVVTDPSTDIRHGDELFQIHFDGHSITSADELYHTVWETFSDHLSIVSPIAGRICQDQAKETAQSVEEDGIDETTVLLEIATPENEWVSRQNSLVTELEYLKMVERKPRGAFY